MGLSLSSYALWILSTVLELTLCLLMLWRGLHRRLPYFFAYVLIQFLTGCLGWVLNREFDFWSLTFYYVGWTLGAIVMVAGWLVTAELCYRGLQAYRGIWAMTWRLLLVLSALFLLHATYDASKETHRIGALNLILQRDLALASAVILLVILIIGRRYASQLDGIEQQVALGLCVYFITIILSNSFLIRWYAAIGPHSAAILPFGTPGSLVEWGSIRRLEYSSRGVVFRVAETIARPEAGTDPASA